MNMSDLIPSDVKYNWEQITSVSLTENEWLAVKCYLLDARQHETNELLIKENMSIRSKIDDQLRHGVAQ
jgi:hypothetical protein